MTDDVKQRELTIEEKNKLEAETRKVELEAQKILVEMEKLRVETAAGKRGAEVQIQQQEEYLARERIITTQLSIQHNETMASNKYHHKYNFNSEVSDSSVQNCMHQLNIWDRQDSECDIEIVFQSPGGSVIAGMALFDYIQMLRHKGHKVTTGTLGYAASMAGILLQAGDVRWMGKEAWVLIHEASFGAFGKMGEVEDTVEWIKRVQERILDIFAERSKMKKGLIKKNWTRKDWWLNSDECLTNGFVDEVR